MKTPKLPEGFLWEVRENIVRIWETIPDWVSKEGLPYWVDREYEQALRYFTEFSDWFDEPVIEVVEDKPPFEKVIKITITGIRRVVFETEVDWSNVEDSYEELKKIRKRWRNLQKIEPGFY